MTFQLCLRLIHMRVVFVWIWAMLFFSTWISYFVFFLTSKLFNDLSHLCTVVLCDRCAVIICRFLKKTTVLGYWLEYCLASVCRSRNKNDFGSIVWAARFLSLNHFITVIPCQEFNETKQLFVRCWERNAVNRYIFRQNWQKNGIFLIFIWSRFNSFQWD